MRSARNWRPLLGLLPLLLLLGGSAADAQQKIAFEITVLKASPEKGSIDKDAQRFNRILGRKLRYESLTIIDRARRKVAVDGIATVKLPAGGDFRFRPIDMGEKGVLLAVDWARTAQGDFRMPMGKPLIFGGPSYQGGQLVVILEAR